MKVNEERLLLFCIQDSTSNWKQYEVHSIDLWPILQCMINEIRVHIRGEYLALIQYWHNSKLSNNLLHFVSTLSQVASFQYTLVQGKEDISFLQQFLCMDDRKHAFYHMTFAWIRSMHFSCTRHGKLASYLEMVAWALLRRICILLPHFARKSCPCDMVHHCTWCRSSCCTHYTWSYSEPCD